MDLTDTLIKLAENSVKNQVVNNGDYIENGILMCGVCKCPKQTVLDFPVFRGRGRVLGAVPCKCEIEAEERKKRDRRNREILAEIKYIPQIDVTSGAFSTATFDNFKVDTYNEKNLMLCRWFAEGFDERLQKNQGLLFWGGVGTGKSYSAACIVNHLRGQEPPVPVVVTSFVMLLEAIQNGGMTDSEIIKKLNLAKLVVFDDLGAERDTGYALEKVYSIVDSRSRRRLPMIFTTNLTLEEMKAEKDVRYRRIYDRVFETCTPMQFTGKSWRMKEASRRYNDMEGNSEPEEPAPSGSAFAELSDNDDDGEPTF